MTNLPGTTYDVVDPATLEVVGQAPRQGVDDVRAAVNLATRAGRDWARDRAARRTALAAAADSVAAGAAEMGHLLSREQGKPLAEAIGEFQVAAGLLRHAATMEWDESETLPDRDGRAVRVNYHPVGLVAAITPWNFPISLLTVKLAPALVSGCPVIAKPAPTTPLSTIALVETINRHLPHGVLTAVTGDGDVSRALSELPGVRKVSFTGSTQVGAAIMAQAAPTVKRVTLELGGNDPAILLPDADLADAAQRIAGSAFRNAGQVCMAAKRVFVPRSLASDFTDALVAAASRLTVGHGIDPATTMGPMHNARQAEFVRGLVDKAVADGARIACGGGRGTDLPGHFMAPTVVTCTTLTDPLVAEEQFGAALPVVAYDDPGALIEHLNGEEFGLGASVWSQDLTRAQEVARTIESGTVWINQHTQVELDAPFGGRKASGIGRERGRWGLDEYLETQTVNIRLP